MDSKQQLTGLKKRQQIANANKMIFVWVIVASVVVSLCGVTIQFLVRQAIFNQQVIAAKLETQGTLSQNLENVTELKRNIDNLQADANLAKVKANPEDTNLKVVLDALPTTDDKSALGASLQQVVLPKSQVDTTDLTTISQIGGSGIDAGMVTDGVNATQAVTSDFNFTSNGNYGQLQAMLRDLERTIRPIDVQTVIFQSNEGTVRATVGGVTYYYPEQTVQLGKKTIKP